MKFYIRNVRDSFCQSTISVGDNAPRLLVSAGVALSPHLVGLPDYHSLSPAEVGEAVLNDGVVTNSAFPAMGLSVYHRDKMRSFTLLSASSTVVIRESVRSSSLGFFGGMEGVPSSLDGIKIPLSIALTIDNRDGSSFSPSARSNFRNPQDTVQTVFRDSFSAGHNGVYDSYKFEPTGMGSGLSAIRGVSFSYGLGSPQLESGVRHKFGSDSSSRQIMLANFLRYKNSGTIPNRYGEPMTIVGYYGRCCIVEDYVIDVPVDVDNPVAKEDDYILVVGQTIQRVSIVSASADHEITSIVPDSNPDQGLVRAFPLSDSRIKSSFQVHTFPVFGYRFDPTYQMCPYVYRGDLDRYPGGTAVPTTLTTTVQLKPFEGPGVSTHASVHYMGQLVRLNGDIMEEVE